MKTIDLTDEQFEELRGNYDYWPSDESYANHTALMIYGLLKQKYPAEFKGFLEDDV